MRRTISKDASDFVTEQILRALHGRLPVAIPMPILESEGVCLRTRVSGRSGLEFHHSAMNDSVLGAAYAVEIGRLCAAIHSALSTSEVKTLIAAGLPTTLRAAHTFADPLGRRGFALVEAHRPSRSRRRTVPSSTVISEATTSSWTAMDGSADSSTSRKPASAIGTTSVGGSRRSAKTSWHVRLPHIKKGRAPWWMWSASGVCTRSSPWRRWVGACAHRTAAHGRRRGRLRRSSACGCRCRRCGSWSDRAPRQARERRCPGP
jgi:hypothetical protein